MFYQCYIIRCTMSCPVYLNPFCWCICWIRWCIRLFFFCPGDDVSRPGGPGGTKVGVLRSHGNHMTTQPGQDNTEDDTTNRSQRYKRTTMYNVERLVWSRFAALCFEFVNKWNSFDVYDSLWSLTDRSRNIHKFVAFGVAQGESTGHSQGRQGLDFGCLS